MGWEEIIKYKRRRRSERAIREVDKLMSDLKPRTVRGIIDDLYDLPKIIGRNRQRTLSDLIPTTRELKYYLGRSSKYTSKKTSRKFPDGSSISETVYQLRDEQNGD